MFMTNSGFGKKQIDESSSFFKQLGSIDVFGFAKKAPVKSIEQDEHKEQYKEELSVQNSSNIDITHLQRKPINDLDKLKQKFKKDGFELSSASNITDSKNNQENKKIEFEESETEFCETTQDDSLVENDSVDTVEEYESVEKPSWTKDMVLNKLKYLDNLDEDDLKNLKNIREQKKQEEIKQEVLLEQEQHKQDTQKDDTIDDEPLYQDVSSTGILLGGIDMEDELFEITEDSQYIERDTLTPSSDNILVPISYVTEFNIDEKTEVLSYNKDQDLLDPSTEELELMNTDNLDLVGKKLHSLNDINLIGEIIKSGNGLMDEEDIDSFAPKRKEVIEDVHDDELDEQSMDELKNFLQQTINEAEIEPEQYMPSENNINEVQEIVEVQENQQIDEVPEVPEVQDSFKEDVIEHTLENHEHNIIEDEVLFEDVNETSTFIEQFCSDKGHKFVKTDNDIISFLSESDNLFRKVYKNDLMLINKASSYYVYIQVDDLIFSNKNEDAIKLLKEICCYSVDVEISNLALKKIIMLSNGMNNDVSQVVEKMLAKEEALLYLLYVY